MFDLKMFYSDYCPTRDLNQNLFKLETEMLHF